MRKRGTHSLESRTDWDATRALLREPFDEEEGAGLTEDQSKALAVVLSGAQHAMDRLLRHKEPLFAGLPPPSSPQCPGREKG